MREKSSPRESRPSESERDKTFGLTDGQLVFLLIFVVWLLFASAITDLGPLLDPPRK